MRSFCFRPMRSFTTTPKDNQFLRPENSRAMSAVVRWQSRWAHSRPVIEVRYSLRYATVLAACEQCFGGLRILTIDGAHLPRRARMMATAQMPVEQSNNIVLTGSGMAAESSA